MCKKWTGKLVGVMHDHKITMTQLAKHMGITREYVSMVLNEHRTPANAEKRFVQALDELLCEEKTAHKDG